MLEFVLALWMQAGVAPPREVGSKVCAGCHKAIYDGYIKTGMARSTGVVGADAHRESLEKGTFRDEALGVVYRVTEGAEGFRLRFARAGTGVRGERMLRWFVGSAHVGRSYLFWQDGFLFQAPVSYFPVAREWALSPGYAGKQLMDVARPVERACLQCHASRVQAVEGSQNGYREPPFLEGGVSCERCHGGGERHVAARGRGGPLGGGEIVNPVKLEAARRDSVCEQCHLTGAARVVKAGRSGAGFRAGDLLPDHLAVFVWSGGKAGEQAATDHAEQMARSGCRRGAGAALACVSCHDPHWEPAAGERVAFYRARCQRCHEKKPCTEAGERRAAAGDDCAGCHMPKGRSQEGEHVAFTDHAIPRGGTRRPGVAKGGGGRRELVPYWPDAVTERDVAIAYAGAGVDHAELRGRALELMERAERGSGNDAALLAQLAQYYDQLGEAKRAQGLYERVLKIDPENVPAGANVGVYWAQGGRMAEAMAMWEKIAARNPGMSSVAVNLAVAQWQSGQVAAAERTLERVLVFHPDLAVARKLRADMRARGGGRR